MRQYKKLLLAGKNVTAMTKLLKQKKTFHYATKHVMTRVAQMLQWQNKILQFVKVLTATGAFLTNTDQDSNLYPQEECSKFMVLPKKKRQLKFKRGLYSMEEPEANLVVWE
ncbi:MAG: hypothetical protein PHD95_00750 [Candidatus ainarchaeum sp.]|nr:hypothetical protein [Candidatus ainarchaeum sp.]